MEACTVDELVQATQPRWDCISVYASMFGSHKHGSLSQGMHAISSCTPPPMLVPHDTKLTMPTVTVCQCSSDSTDSNSWHGLSAFDRQRLHHDYH